MSQISLGQLFLLRRDLKTEINEKEMTLRMLAFHREDQPAPDESYQEQFKALQEMRDRLFGYDMLIESCNSLPDSVEFDGRKLSLHMARHLKVHLNGTCGSVENQIRQIEPMVKRQEQDMIYDQTVVPPAMRPQKFSYKILADLKSMKEEAQKLRKNVRLLDSLIQKADWSIMVVAPE